MTLEFVIPRKALPANHIWKRGNGRTYLTAVAREYKEAIAAHALLAAKKQGWPKKVERCSVIIEARNPHKLADADSFAKLVLDSLQGILFENDRMVHEVTQRKVFDEGEPRVIVTVKA